MMPGEEKGPNFSWPQQKETIHPKKAPQRGLLLGVKERISDNIEKNPSADVSQLVRPFCLGGSVREAVASLCGPAAIEESMCRALA